MSAGELQGLRDTGLETFDEPVALPPYTSYTKPDAPIDVQIASLLLPDEMKDEMKGSGWHPKAVKRGCGSMWDKANTSWTDSWIAETLSCALAVIALACLIATLCYYQGRVLTTLPLKISLNTLVAVYSAVIKASLLMPVAEGKCPGLDAWPD